MVYDMNLDLSNVITISPSTKLSLSDLTLYQLYRVVADPNSIDDTGKQKIIQMLESVNLRAPEWEGQLPDGYDPYDWNNGNKNRLVKLPSDWSWKNTVTDKKGADGLYGTGKFAKRVRAYILKQQGFALPDKFVQDLGQIAGRYSDQSTGTVLRFVDEFNWEAGDFGDPHSCFWGGREEARVMLKDNNAWAVQLFDPESIAAGAPKGTARMWIVRNWPLRGVWTMFNGYGYNMGDPSLVIARLMVNLIGETRFREIKLRNHETTDGTLYINSGNGYVIGEPSEELKERYDFNWPEKILGECCHCGEEVYEEDDHNSLNDRLYCDNCWGEHVNFDEIASESFDPDYEGGTWMKRHNRYGWSEIFVMDSTAEEYGTICNSCNDCFHDDDIIYVETSGNSYCPDCASDEVSCCDNCSTDHENDEMELVGDENLCPVCAEEAHEEIAKSLLQQEEDDLREAELELQEIE